MLLFVCALCGGTGWRGRYGKAVLRVLSNCSCHDTKSSSFYKVRPFSKECLKHLCRLCVNRRAGIMSSQGRAFTT